MTTMPAGIAVADFARFDCRIDGRLCELHAGQVVEKAVGLRESAVQTELSSFVRAWMRRRRLGVVTGTDGAFDFGTGNVLIPDLAFVPWSRCPGGTMPTDKISPHLPTLVAEVLSDSNTETELRSKRTLYFANQVQLLWEIDLQLRTVAVYTQPDAPAQVLRGADVLTGGTVLPGFALALPDLFAVLDESEAPAEMRDVP
jgi:Uma2 family endonuclease